MQGVHSNEAGIYTIVVPLLESVLMMPVIPVEAYRADSLCDLIGHFDEIEIKPNPQTRLARAQCAVIEANRAYLQARGKRDKAVGHQRTLSAVRYLATVSGSDFGVLVDHAPDATGGVLTMVEVDTLGEYQNWLDDNLDRTVGKAMFKALRN